ncbi:MAG: hypothetical protein AB7O96_13530 [Pseudobdellovibrionaceae bacterium]
MEVVAIILVGVLVFVGIAAYVFLMLYYPEWVGITGKAAHQTLDQHTEGSEAKADIDLLHEENKKK